MKTDKDISTVKVKARIYWSDIFKVLSNNNVHPEFYTNPKYLSKVRAILKETRTEKVCHYHIFIKENFKRYSLH